MKRWLKLILAITIPAILLASIFVVAVLYLFTQAQQHQDTIKSFLSERSGYQIDFDDLATELDAAQAKILVKEFRVTDESGEQRYLDARHIAIGFDLLAWQQGFPVIKFAVAEQPFIALQVDELGKLLFAGKPLTKRAGKTNIQDQIQRALDLDFVYVNDGELLWQPFNKKAIHYNNIAVHHHRAGSNREFTAAAQTPKGKLRVGGEVQGNPLHSRDWQANLNVFDTLNWSLLEPEDFELEVKDGKGRLRLQEMNLRRLYDVVTVLGTRDPVSKWLIRSDLNGLLSEIDFTFEGSLDKLDSWELSAKASDIAFKAYESAPGLSKLNAQLLVNQDKATVNFESENGRISAPNIISRGINFDTFKGQLDWRRLSKSNSNFEFSELVFNSNAIDIDIPYAKLLLSVLDNEVRLIADFFKQKSVQGLEFEDDRIVNSGAGAKDSSGLWLDAKANYKVASIKELSRLFPDTEKNLFKSWWQNAFISGELNDGEISYQGFVHKGALKDSASQLKSSARFSDLNLKYAIQDTWPKVNKASGKLTLLNDQLEFVLDDGLYGNGDIKTGNVVLSSLWSNERLLQIDTRLDIGLPEVMQFMFDGPFVRSRENHPPALTADAGEVIADMNISIPLSKVTETRLQGRATLANGSIRIGQNLELEDTVGELDFTERSLDAKGLRGESLGGRFTADITTVKAAKPPSLEISIQGETSGEGLTPLVGVHVASFLEGNADYAATVLTEPGKVQVDVQSDLLGLKVDLPEPAFKEADAPLATDVRFVSGNQSIQKQFLLKADDFQIEFNGDLNGKNRLIDKGLIRWGDWDSTPEDQGIHFQVAHQRINLDRWISKVIDLSKIPVAKPSSSKASEDTFLKRMRSLQIYSADTHMLGRPFKKININALSDGDQVWSGRIQGERIEGSITADLSEPIKDFSADLSYLFWGSAKDDKQLSELNPINTNLVANLYPSIKLDVERFSLFDRYLGRLKLSGASADDHWSLNEFKIDHPGFSLTAGGRWSNQPDTGSLSQFKSKLVYDGVGDILDDYRFAGFIRNGKGSLDADLKWIGAPHEFDMRRLNGNFDFDVRDGVLSKVDAGSGKLLGLFNFNTIFRRFLFDFSDLFSSGLKFDDMRFSGVLGDGEMLFQDAFIYSPSIFLQAEGRVGLAKKDIDMDINVSPELGGNLTLISAIANPTAGAVLFLSQRLFRSEQWGPTVQRYHINGGWDDIQIEKQTAGSDSEASAESNAEFAN